MKKENLMMPTAGGAAGPFTRARDAAGNLNGAFLSREMSKLQDHKLHPTNPKRAASDEWNGSTSSIPCNPPKKRALLKDITNVTCDNLYGNCLNASEIPSKRKDDRKGSVLLSVVPGKKSPTTHRQHPGVSVKGNLLHYGKSIQSTTEDITDIDANQSDPQLCCLYASDIYSYFHVGEINRRPNSSYMETIQQDITQTMRAVLIDWLVEVCEEYKLVPDTLYLTVYLIDKFLSRNCITRQRLQLLGITCLLIASKFEEICAPRVEELCFITESTYTKKEVLELESEILNNLGFQLSVPTAKTFLRRFLLAALSSYNLPEDLNDGLEFLAKYLTELTLIHYGFLQFLPSANAASAIFLARWTVKQSGNLWNGTLEHYTRYKASDLRTNVFALQRLQLSSDPYPSNAIRAKYHQDKYKSVAALTSPVLQDWLFQM